METLKILAFILIGVLAGFWGILGAVNEFSGSKRKSRITYIVGSLLSAAIMMLLMLLYLKRI